ncbi:hypothetical protein [Brevibacterium aurantiacum]|nr:hypothetical protein [Brevibacterium aurantiacum]SJM53155.1 ABC transport system integral membrane protein [Frigoribacterium sp. JB110]SMX93118.1 hypothetical protein BSP109_02691 [Brevibacterium sp. Mu109]
MFSVIRSEFTKFLTLPGVWLVTGVIVLLFIYMQQSLHADHVSMIANVRPDGTADIGLGVVEVASQIRGSIGTAVMNAGLLLPVLGAVIAGSEFKAGQLGLSLVAVPNRTRFVLSKVFAVGLYAAGLAIVFIAAALVLMYLAVKDWDPDVLWSAQTLQEAGRVLLYMVTITLTGAAITLVTRRTLSGIIVSIVLITLTFAQVVALIAPAVDAFLPLSAARNLMFQDAAILPVPLTGTELQGALVLTGWAAITSVVALVLIRRRDAR